MPNKSEPTFSVERVLKEQKDLYEKFVEMNQGKNPEEVTAALIGELAFLKASQMQLTEALLVNRDVQKGAFDNSRLAVQKFQELEAHLNLQGKSFSERLERLEGKIG